MVRLKEIKCDLCDNRATSVLFKDRLVDGNVIHLEHRKYLCKACAEREMFKETPTPRPAIFDWLDEGKH